jgi:hypothetical protein
MIEKLSLQLRSLGGTGVDEFGPSSGGFGARHTRFN